MPAVRADGPGSYRIVGRLMRACARARSRRGEESGVCVWKPMLDAAPCVSCVCVAVCVCVCVTVCVRCV